MAKIITIVDETTSNEIVAYVNSNNRCYISCGELKEDDGFYSGYTTLSHQDLKDLISILKDCLNEMENG